MRRTIRELAFRSFAQKDDAFIASLARRAFASWSRDPGGSLLGMIHAPNALCEIAVVGDERVGIFVMSTRRLPRPFGPIASPVTAHLDAIAVIPKMSGRGVGRALLSRAERRARAEGAVVMSLMTAVSNVAAQSLFSKQGYMKTHVAFGAYANQEDAFELFKPL